MKKVLFVATVVKKHINVFHLPYLKWFKENGYETHVCARNDFDDPDELSIPFCDKYYDLPFERSPLKTKNINIYKQLKKIIKSNSYDLIHCHTPMGGVLTRLAAKSSRKNGTKVLYTAHGFHFFKGAPLRNWLLYYPIEKWLSKHTDCLITINREDYQTVKSKLKTVNINMVNGVGIDCSKFIPQTSETKVKIRREYGYSEQDFILIYAGELSYRKHQDLLIKAVSHLSNKIPNIKLLLIGEGDLLAQYKQQVTDLGLKEKVKFLGFRKDVSNLMLIADVSVSSSRQEGLPVNVMEAMATGLPLVVTDCRGNRDLVIDGENGFVVGIDDVDNFALSVEKLFFSDNTRYLFGRASLNMVETYSLSKVIEEMKGIYSKYI
ncbi:glycosyltransferase family 4 protein [Lysinibacillus sp. SGAir0095]|uniref:glycosyltransferase family 4 protein n=1 Tax=Lysinibacillus sp. SGAir0095 TaxID=2070463 RepID=UPI0010CD0795|nr:glycosyltransferase family 4 protein [Lysinibacillus sp. SGAir0095]QCR31886.1 glycosyltransferase family 1 protein [Lysinibacillus sp. SGAir0095]